MNSVTFFFSSFKMADTKAVKEKPSTQQFEDAIEKSPYSAESKMNGISADAEGSSLGPPSFEGVDEAAVLRKMDIRLIPMLSMLYLLAFLDRGNIGNAKIEGLVDDLHMTGPQYNWTLTVFFFTYCVFELPSNLLLKKLRPSRWLPLIMVAWGIVMTLMGVVKDYGGLLATRLFLGVAGLYPGVAYYITLWYPRHRAQFRQAMFFSAASVAGAFSGLLAYAIAKMDGVGGYAGWRWIFILEGLLTVFVALVAPFSIHDSPETATFLTEKERQFVIHSLRIQNSSDSHEMVVKDDKFQWRYVYDAFTDWQIWLGLFMYWGITCPFHQLRNCSLQVPIYITAAIVAVIAAWVSDRRKQRSPFILFFMGMIAIGFIICLASTGRGVPGVMYFGIFVAVVGKYTDRIPTYRCAVAHSNLGIYPAFPGNVTWLSVNMAGDYKRAAGMAIYIGIGNLAGAMSSNFYRAQDAPNYILGHSLELAFVVVGMIAAVVLRLAYQRINKKRDAMDPSEYPSDPDSLGDRSPLFRYML
ncbi:unnamed protein product [Penicillium salamii]|nr:unnamed protein product [Penicillium salamii]CAG8290202.1 unnamed protein product [Penicillium salamii]CAG8399712.1 unnamed protein product [Penicillium salamii]